METNQRLKSLVQLALVDNSFEATELSYIKNLGKAINIPEEEIDNIINEELKSKEFQSVDVSGLAFEHKMEYLVTLIELMKVDGKIYLSEVRYCKGLAEKLGFKRAVVEKLISKVHADPMLNTDWDRIRKEIEKQMQD